MAGRLRKLPVTATAYRDGTLAKGQVEVILAKLDDTTIDSFAQVEAELMPHLAPLGLSGCSRAMARWADQAEELNESSDPERSLHLSTTLDGRHVLEGHLDAEGGAVVAAALALATVDDPDRTPAERRGDALVDVSRFFLDHQNTHTAVGSGPTSAWWPTWTRSRKDVGDVSSAGPPSTGPRCRGSCATARCTGS